MIEAKKYDEQFFMDIEKSAFDSAKIVLPIVKDFINPDSVVDIGCGTGMWLHVWDSVLGVKKYLGVEGPYVKKEMLKVPEEKVLFKDLKEQLNIEEKFDLVMSLEVAEHLPEDKAELFIENLVKLGDVVLFSAAIPGQGGTFHINEQYPEYWAKLFHSKGYVVLDAIRPFVWNSPQVDFWYKQNILLYVKKERLKNYPRLLEFEKSTFPDYLSRIHPVFFDLINRQLSQTRSIFGFVNWKWYTFKQRFKGTAK